MDTTTRFGKTIYLAHYHFQAAHLETVKAQMADLGAPTIRVVDCGDHYQAIEGCHRLRAAKALGLSPVIVVLGDDMPISEIEGLDIEIDSDAGLTTAGDLAGWLADAPRLDAVSFAEIEVTA